MSPQKFEYFCNSSQVQNKGATLKQEALQDCLFPFQDPFASLKSVGLKDKELLHLHRFDLKKPHQRNPKAGKNLFVPLLWF